MTRRAARSRVLFAACALLAVAGAAVLDDYGVSFDEDTQLRRAETYWRHFADGAELFFTYPHNKFYGVAFDLPLLLAGKALGLDDLRHVYLLRHASGHLLFLAGALCCGLLARRMTGSALAALLAFALFALQPRIYAHAFFNSKDVPALALFAACLWLAHRAFRGGGPGAFLLCGAAAAVLTNLRLSAGLTLAIAVAAARVFDLVLASGAAERRRVLAASGAFAAGWTGVLYAISPYMWVDGPAALIDAAETLARHDNPVDVLFQGRIFPLSGLPARYFPVWFAVSTPPVLLALGLAGFAIALRRGLARPGAALRNTPARFALLAAACWAGPQLAAAFAGVHAYNGWRHMFFIHAPFCVLAAIAAAALARSVRRMAPGARGGAMNALNALAVAGAAAAASSVVLLHPHQQVYFNGLEDRTTPRRIGERYDFGYWGPAFRAGLERVLAERPDAVVRGCSVVTPLLKRNMRILRREDRERIAVAGTPGDCDVLFPHPTPTGRRGRPIVPPAWSLAAYGSPFLELFDMDEVSAARRRTDAPILARPPGIAARFDVRIIDRELIYARSDCAPEDLEPRFFLHVEPADPADLPEDRRRHGFDNRDFTPRGWTPAYPRPPRRATRERIDSRCVVQAPLPDYPVRRLRTGQFAPDGGGGLRRLWEGEIDVAGAGRR